MPGRVSDYYWQGFGQPLGQALKGLLRAWRRISLGGCQVCAYMPFALLSGMGGIRAWSDQSL